MSVPTPPIHAPAWILGWHSKCHEPKMEDIQIPYDLSEGQQKSSGQVQERHTLQALLGGTCSWQHLAAPGGQKSPGRIHFLTWHRALVEHLPLSTTLMGNQSNSRSL